MAEYLTLMDKRKYAAAERLLLECLNDDPTDGYVLSQLALVSWYRHKDDVMQTGPKRLIQQHHLHFIFAPRSFGRWRNSSNP